MFNGCHRLIQQIKYQTADAHTSREKRLAYNVISSLVSSLQQKSIQFQSMQSNYLNSKSLSPHQSLNYTLAISVFNYIMMSYYIRTCLYGIPGSWIPCLNYWAKGSIAHLFIIIFWICEVQFSGKVIDPQLCMWLVTFQVALKFRSKTHYLCGSRTWVPNLERKKKFLFNIGKNFCSPILSQCHV